MQTRTITIGTAVISVGYPDGATEFSTPNTLLCSYVDSSLQVDSDIQTPTLNWQGMPLSVSQFYDAEVGTFFALDTITTTESGFITSELDDPGIAEHTTWNGNKLQISLVDNKYYLNIIDTGITADPYNKITFQGTAQATGVSDELILNDSGFTPTDIEELKSISLGGVPITIGRVGFKYYLIVKLMDDTTTQSAKVLRVVATASGDITPKFTFATGDDIELYIDGVYHSDITTDPFHPTIAVLEGQTIIYKRPSGWEGVTKIDLENDVIEGDIKQFCCFNDLTDLRLHNTLIYGDIGDLNSANSVLTYVQFDNTNLIADAGCFDSHILLTVLTCADNEWTQIEVDNCLASLVTSYTSGDPGRKCLASLAGSNSAPSVDGLADKAILDAALWTVTVTP